MRKKVQAKKELQLRAELKGLEEQRAELLQEMQDLTEQAETEQRAFSEEEDQKFTELEKKITEIDSTIEAKERARKLDNKTQKEDKSEKKNTEELEERAFISYIKGEVLNERAGEINMTTGDNGAVIPKTIAQKIIKKVIEICPIYSMATRYHVKGTLSIPYYDEETSGITMAYATEFQELESKAGKFTNIELSGFLAGALTKISKSLLNNSQFDVLGFIINAMADTISRFIEGELLKGTIGKVEGLSGVKLEIVTAKANEINADEMICLKDSVKDAFQKDCCFIMHSNTRTKLRLLKDNNGRYLLQDDITTQFGTTFLGKPVYVTDTMDEVAAGKTPILYGDFSGLAVKLAEEANIEVLREKFATQHAVGVIAWMEFDSKVENTQKIAKLKMKTA